MSSLSTYRSVILALLDDPYNSRYSTALVDSALRLALQEYSTSHPPLLTYNIDGTGSNCIVMPADFQPARLVRCELHDDLGEAQVEVRFTAQYHDHQWVIETVDRQVKTGETLDVFHLAGSHSIADLDGAAATSLPERDEPWVQMGAAGFAALSRATSLAEANVIQPDATRHILEVALKYLAESRRMLALEPRSQIGLLPQVPGDRF